MDQPKRRRTSNVSQKDKDSAKYWIKNQYVQEEESTLTNLDGSVNELTEKELSNGSLSNLTKRELAEFNQDLQTFIKVAEEKYTERLLSLQKRKQNLDEETFLAFKPKSDHKHDTYDFSELSSILSKKMYAVEEYEMINSFHLMLLNQVTTFQVFAADWLSELRDMFMTEEIQLRLVFLHLSALFRSNLSPKDYDQLGIKDKGFELYEKYILVDYTNNVITLVFGLDPADVFYVLLCFRLTKNTGFPSLKIFEERIGPIPKNMNYLFDTSVTKEATMSLFLNLKVRFISSFYYCCGCNFNY